MQPCLLLISESWDERVRRLMLIMHASVLFFVHDNKTKLILGSGGKISIMWLNACLWKSQSELLLKVFWLSLSLIYGVSFPHLATVSLSGSLGNHVPCELLKMKVSCVHHSWLLKNAISFLESYIIHDQAGIRQEWIKDGVGR